MTPDIRKERETALYEAALRLIAKGVNPAAMKVQQIADEAGIGSEWLSASISYSIYSPSSPLMTT